MIINTLCNPAVIFQGYYQSLDRIYSRCDNIARRFQCTLKNTFQNVPSKIAFYQGCNEHVRRRSDFGFCAR